MLSEIAAWVAKTIESIILALGYPGIALVMLVENLFPPIPSELVMPFAGFLAAQGRMDLLTVILSGSVGSILGALILYYFGWWADEAIIRTFIRRWGRYIGVSEGELDRALAFFARYGDAVVFFGRLIPIIRSLISIPAGMRHMPLGRFLFFTTIGTVIWNVALTLAGLWLGARWEEVLSFLKVYQNLTLAVCVIAVIGFIVLRITRARRAPSGA
jgi:membrane protein DedA with SNARE-associated domain